MRRKGLWLALLSVAVVGLAAAMGWVEDRRADDSEVGWSPLYERRVTDALIPLTSEPAYAGFLTASTCTDWTCDCRTTDDCVTLYCPTAFDLPCEEPEEFPTSDSPTCDTCDEQVPCAPTGSPTCGPTCCCDAASTYCSTCQCAPDQAGAPDLYDVYTFEGTTCQGMATCDQFTCYCPTSTELTCERPTCDGPTCAGPTCEGDTCFQKDCDVFDFGDAYRVPGVLKDVQFPTRKKQDGARHSIDGVYFLGGREDPESDGQPTDLADGDDGEAYQKDDDEDGVWFPTTLNPGRKATVIVRASQAGTLLAWLDCTADGNWGFAVDAILGDGIETGPGFEWVAVELPKTASAAPRSFARFRFASSGKLSAAGEADDGEVEDYRVVIPATFRAWVMPDGIHYAAGDPVKLSVYLNETAQVTVLVHRPDGTQKALVTTTAEAGVHLFPEQGETYRAELPAGTTTIEVVSTSLKSGVTVWLTTPYDVSE